LKENSENVIAVQVFRKPKSYSIARRELNLGQKLHVDPACIEFISQLQTRAVAVQIRLSHKESETSTSTLRGAGRGDDEWDWVEDMKMGFGLCDNLERSAIFMHEYPLTLRFCISHPEFQMFVWIQQFLCKQKELYSVSKKKGIVFEGTTWNCGDFLKSLFIFYLAVSFI
jgi:hypothetical protein